LSSWEERMERALLAMSACSGMRVADVASFEGFEVRGEV
jgi:hypothetical protein